MRQFSHQRLLVVAIIFLHSVSKGSADSPDFGKQVYPILKQHCLRCHAAPYTDARSGRLKKPKGGIRLDTIKFLKEGYIDDEDKPKKLFVPGKPEASPLYTSTALPPDHDDIMPATGDPLTLKEQALIKNWILGGAKFNGFEPPKYTNPKAKK